LPHQSDNPDPSTLPQTDLNPLVNPILAKNIGRWAEVYFTNPPEKRDRAVQELVRELERENLNPEYAVAPQPSPRQLDLETDKTPPSKIDNVPAEGLTCHSCGYVNRPKHKFCGRCGIGIAPPTVEVRAEKEPQTDFLAPSPESPESPIFGFESTRSWQAYRLYAGAALALVVLILGYMAWRGAQTPSRASHVAPQAPPAVPNPVASTPPANPKADTPSRMPPTANRPGDSPSRTAATTPTEALAKTNPADTSLPAPVSPSSEDGAGTPAINGGGSEELAIARILLNGSNGKEQNRAQAVPWLWKAVAKQNVEATVLLSDLYLRGDGVPKNCEQARLLLDAAALKGRKDAAVQLRNLQAFGCE